MTPDTDQPETNIVLAFLRLRSRLPEAAGPEARVLGGKWNDLGVLSGVLGSEPPVN